MFHVLKRPGPDDQMILATSKEFDNRADALEAAKSLCRLYQWSLLVVQDVDEVQMAAVVVNSFVPPQPPPSATVYRGGLETLAALNAEEFVGPPREPQKRPKLLVMDTTPTDADLAQYQMVVAGGKIIKNAFGALEVEDMPLSTEELLQVKRALGPRE